MLATPLVKEKKMKHGPYHFLSLSRIKLGHWVTSIRKGEVWGKGVGGCTGKGSPWLEKGENESGFWWRTRSPSIVHLSYWASRISLLD